LELRNQKRTSAIVGGPKVNFFLKGLIPVEENSFGREWATRKKLGVWALDKSKEFGGPSFIDIRAMNTESGFSDRRVKKRVRVIC
jgi:hypothetical protein